MGLRGLLNGCLNACGLGRWEAGWWVRGFAAKARRGEKRSCVVCGAPGAKWLTLVGEPATWLRGGTVRVSVCEACERRVLKGRWWDRGMIGVVWVSGAVVALVVRAMVPWVGVVGLSVGVMVSCGLVLAVWVARGRARVQVEPAQVVMDGAYRGIATGDEGVGSRIAGELEGVVERGRWGALCHVRVWIAAMLALLVLPGWVWWRGQARVRVVNQGRRSWELFVDGRSYGVVPPLPGENAGAIREVSVPSGWRLLEARWLDGREVDRGWARVDRDGEGLYAPPVPGRCYWVERRGYGASKKGPDREMRLPHDRSFHSFSEPIDVWFAPIPEGQRRDRWFSGGIQRAVRVGACTSLPPAH